MAGEKGKGMKINIGAVITEPGSSMQYKTGSWRTFMPRLDSKKCTKCYLCWMYCPDAAIKITEKGMVYIDYNYCKGCLICVHQCAVGALKKEVEEK